LNTYKKEFVLWLKKNLLDYEEFWREFREFRRSLHYACGCTNKVHLLKSLYGKSSSFIKLYNSWPESRDYPLENHDFYYLNGMFGQVLGISNAKNEDICFTDMVNTVFPYGRKMLQYKQQNRKLPSFSSNIDLPMD